MRTVARLTPLLFVMLTGLAACGNRELTPEESAQVQALREELHALDEEIAAARAEDQRFAGGLVKALIATRLELLKTTRLLVQQRVHAIESGAPLNVEIPATDPNPQEAARLESEITVATQELESARQEAAKYSGGLVQAVKLSTVATQEQTLAMLKQRYLSAKYGLALPTAAQAETKAEPASSAPSSPPPQLPPAGEGPFGLQAGLTTEQLETALGGQLTPIEGTTHLFGAPRVPRPHTAFESYALLVAPESGLCQIRAIGVDIPTSRHGLQLKSAFDDMAAALSDVYGSPERIDRLLPGSIWNEPEDWTMGLVKRERFLRAQWSSSSGASLKNELESVTLAAQASSSDTGYLLLQYTFSNNTRCEAEIKQAGQRAL